MKPVLTILLLAGAAVLLGVEGYRARSTTAPDKEYAQSLAKVENVRAACEERISAMDKAMAAGQRKTYEMFCSSPRGGCSSNVLQLEQKQRSQQHDLLLRECTLKRLSGNTDTTVRDVWLKDRR